MEKLDLADSVLSPRANRKPRAGARSGRRGKTSRLGDLEDTMTTDQKIIRAKVGLPARQIARNVSKDRKMMGYHRDSFYPLG